MYAVEVNKENIINIFRTTMIRNDGFRLQGTPCQKLSSEELMENIAKNESPYATMHTRFYGIVSLFRNE